MSEDPFVRTDQTKKADTKFCPLIQSDCRGEGCQWWVADFMEDRQAYRMDCAVALVAKGLTDESLLRLK